MYQNKPNVHHLVGFTTVSSNLLYSLKCRGISFPNSSNFYIFVLHPYTIFLMSHLYTIFKHRDNMISFYTNLFYIISLYIFLNTYKIYLKQLESLSILHLLSKS